MAVNPSIALGVKGIELQDPLAQYGRVAAIQGAQQQNALARMQMDEYERARAEEEGLRNYLAQANVTSPDVRANLLRYGKSGIAIGKALSEQEKAALERQELAGRVALQPVAKLTAETKLVDDKLKQSRAFLDTLDPTDPNAPQQYLAWHQANHRDPVLGPMLAARGVTEEQSLGRIQQAIQAGPQAFAQLINQSKLGTDKFMEMNKPVFTSQTLGGTVRAIQTPGLGGTATVVPGSAAAVTMAPGEAERIAIARQQLRVAQAAEGRQAQEFAQRDKVVARTITDESGATRFFNRLGEEIAPKDASGALAAGPIKGKPSAAFEKTQTQRAQMQKDLGTAITELKDAVKEGGLIDQSTGSGVGRATDIAARMVGKALPGDIAIGKLAPIADIVLKMVPRFEGPQSDKDTASYKQAAGQLADPGMPREIRKEAAKTIVRLMENRKGQFVSPEMAAGGVSPAVAPDIDALLNKYK